jgi:uncharacterized protein (DUF885 family)
LVSAAWLAIPVVSAHAVEPAQYERELDALAVRTGNDTARLHQLFDLNWKHKLADSPESATFLGYPDGADRWNDESLTAIARRKREHIAEARAIVSIDPARLSDADRLSWGVFRYEADNRVRMARFPRELLPIDMLSGPHNELPRLLAHSAASSASDYRNLLARLDGIPTVLDQTVALLREGVRRKIVPARITLRAVPDQLRSLMEPDPAKSPLTTAFANMPAAIPADKQAELRARAAGILAQRVVPAVGKFRDYLAKTYLPACRESIGLSALPDGAAWYDAAIAERTTTTLTAKQVHEIGLAEVARLRKAMEQVMVQSGWTGTLPDFQTYLRTDPRFFYTSADELLRRYRDIAKRIDPQLTRLFGKLPRLPYGIVPTPAFSAKSQPTAYYEGGSLRSGQPGQFFANTYDLPGRPSWEMESLTLHEAVPGHHLQIALAQENEDLPEFRRHGGFTAYVEGWGLYAESLGYEIGLFKDPYSRYGQLSFEMWRAARLVVDTGLHAMNWTRKQAIDYFKQNTARAEHDIEVEVDRYISWPGQALGYKIGQLRIRALRERAERSLGDRFDERKFHDAVLADGALPLDVLDAQVARKLNLPTNTASTPTGAGSP